MPTKKITSFEKSDVLAISAEVKAALQVIADKYGITLSPKGRTYRRDAMPVFFEFTITAVSADGQVLSREAQDFQKYAAEFTFEPTDLGREFTNRGETFRIVGLKPNAHAYPILGQNVKTGKVYKFPPSIKLRLLPVSSSSAA
jgi:hypothetical protein